MADAGTAAAGEPVPGLASRQERFDRQPLDGREVFEVGGEHRQSVFERGGGDERIAHLLAVAQGERLTLLHQYQREVRTVQHKGKAVRYIEVTPADIATANRLAHEVLGRTLDELPPQTRKLLTALHAWVASECQRQAIKRGDFRFSRRQVRELTGWGDTQLRVHLDRLVQMEYLLAHGGRRGLLFEYELVYDGQGDDGGAFLMGLQDMAGIDSARTGNSVLDYSQATTASSGFGAGRIVGETLVNIVSAMEYGPAGVLAAGPLGVLGKAAKVGKYEVGAYDALKGKSIAGDGLDIHHAMQKYPASQAVGGYSPATGPSIAVPRGEHSMIPTLKGEYSGSARDLLAKDIRDLRNNTNAPNNSLRDLIDLNKLMYPGAFGK